MRLSTFSGYRIELNDFGRHWKTRIAKRCLNFALRLLVPPSMRFKRPGDWVVLKPEHKHGPLLFLHEEANRFSGFDDVRAVTNPEE